MLAVPGHPAEGPSDRSRQLWLPAFWGSSIRVDVRETVPLPSLVFTPPPWL